MARRCLSSSESIAFVEADAAVVESGKTARAPDTGVTATLAGTGENRSGGGSEKIGPLDFDVGEDGFTTTGGAAGAENTGRLMTTGWIAGGGDVTAEDGEDKGVAAAGFTAPAVDAVVGFVVPDLLDVLPVERNELVFTTAALVTTDGGRPRARRINSSCGIAYCAEADNQAPHSNPTATITRKQLRSLRARQFIAGDRSKAAPPCSGCIRARPDQTSGA